MCPAPGRGWTCSAAVQVVTCNHPPPLALGATLPDLSLTVLPGQTAAPSKINTAVVSSASLDFNTANDTANDTTNVVLPNLSTSTKTVSDLNAGDANPGDTLRYTITLRETTGVPAPNVRVTDDIPANVSNFSVVTLPAGAVNNSTGAGTGADGTGFLDVSNITVPANGSVTVVFDVRVAAGTPVGATIDNTANITNHVRAWCDASSAPDHRLAVTDPRHRRQGALPEVRTAVVAHAGARPCRLRSPSRKAPARPGS